MTDHIVAFVEVLIEGKAVLEWDLSRQKIGREHGVKGGSHGIGDQVNGTPVTGDPGRLDGV